MVKVNNKNRINSDKVNSKKVDKGINPFEVHINKQKHKILGQKLKNDRGLPGVSRAKALKKRKNTLLQEYNVFNKSNKFVDRRIGERNTSMTAEDKQMARFTAERLKSHNKKSIYNLADEEILTHRGQTLNEIEKFDDPRSDDDDDEEFDGRKKSGKLDDNFVEDAHFGGGILKKTGTEGAKSHKDLIEQLIAESKKRKAEKQKIREQTIELTEKLDTEWKDLLPLVSKNKKEDEAPASKTIDSYDKVMRELKFEARGQPTDRLKSEEEIAKEEKEKLQKLEQDRLNRMRGIVEEENPAKKHKSADDLDDDFVYDSDPEITLAYGEDGTCLLKPDEPNNQESENEASEAEEEEESDEEQETEDDLSDLKESESESDEDVVNKKQKLNKNNSDKEEESGEKIENNEDEEESEDAPKIKTKLKTKDVNESKEDEEKSDEDEKESEEDMSKNKTKLRKKNQSKLKENEVKEESGAKEEVLRKKTKNNTNKSKDNEDEENEEEKLPKNKTKADQNGASKESNKELKLTNAEEENDADSEDNEEISEPNTSLNKKTKESKNKSITEDKSITENDSCKKKRKLSENCEMESPKKDKLDSDDKKTEEKTRSLIEELLINEKIKEAAAKELPYTFTLPESYEDLNSLLSKHTPEYQAIIIERMLKCNHPNLANGNKQSLSTLFAYLLQHINDSASDQKQCFAILNFLLPQLFDLAQINKNSSHDALIEVIKEKQEEFKKDMKKYPGLDVLLFVKVVGSLFPTSDFRHQVISPTMIFMTQMLTTCRVKTKYDISYGLFLVTMFLEYTVLSKRVVPAALNYLAGILHMAIPKLSVQLTKVTPPFKPTNAHLVLIEKTKSPKELRMTTKDLNDEEINNKFKVKTLYNAAKMLEEFYNNYTNLPSCDELFKPHLSYLEKIPVDYYPKEVKDVLERVRSLIKAGIENRKMSYLVYAAKKPKALRLYEPNIVKVVEGKNHKVMSKEKAEKSKLLHKYKKAMKGALREIRKDQSFLGRVKLKQKIESDRERKEKVNRIFAEASVQQSELNAISRKKKK